MSQSASESPSAKDVVNGEDGVENHHDAASPIASSPQQPPPQPVLQPSPNENADGAAENDAVIAEESPKVLATSTTPSKTPTPRPTLLTGLSQPTSPSSSRSGKKLSPFPEEWGEESAELMDGMRKKSVAIQDANETAIQRLQEELQKSKETLKLRDVEVEKLSKIRDEMGAELEELTASLFEEAHKMVHDANVKRASAEKQVAEANLKIEVLTSEVQALKALVLTSTPNTPNRHMHPQISPSPEKKSFNSGSPNKSLNGGHKRAASHGGGVVSNSILNSSINSNGRSSFGAGGSSSPPKFAATGKDAAANDPANIPLPYPCPKTPQQSGEPTFSVSFVKREQIDPGALEEFSSWIENPILDSTTRFLARIYAEDILPCFSFQNRELADAMLTAIEGNTIVIEPLLHGNTSLPRSSAAYGGRKCALSQLSKACNYKVRLEDDADADSASLSSSSSADAPTWHYISDFCRNRVIAVCDFYTYARYIVQGLVKKKSDDAHETFCHILRLRRNMNLARLGFDTSRDS